MGAPEERLGLRGELDILDRAIFSAVAATTTPKLDAALSQVTATSDHAKIWLTTAALLASFGGHRGRRAAGQGVMAVALSSVTVNLLAKRAAARTRPDPDLAAVPNVRRVPMPGSASFPSGHAASGFAFAGAVGHAIPGLSVPLTLAATIVAYSRVHAGVHYPSDVIAGALAGIACGEFGPRGLDRFTSSPARRRTS